MALVTLTSLKARLGIAASDTGRDDDLEGVITAAESMVRKYLGWNPEVSGTQTAYLNPDSAETLSLRTPPNCPVTILTVHEDGDRDFGADSLLTADEDYAQERAGSPTLIRLNRNWRNSARRMPNRLAAVLLPEIATVKVTYTLDTADALAVAKQACLMECMARANLSYNGMGVGLVTSDSMDGASVTVNTNANPSTAKQGLNGFVSPVVAGMLKDFRFPGIY